MFNRFRLTGRFWTAMGVYWVVFIIAVVVGLGGLNMARDSLREVHQNRMATVAQVDRMLYNFFETRLNILLAFQHDPNGPLFILHDHPIDDHLNPIETNKRTNASVREALTSRDSSAQEQALIDAVFARQGAWRVKLDEAIDAIKREDFSANTMQNFLVAGRTEGEQVVAALVALQRYQIDQASAAAATAEQHYQTGLILFAVIILLGALPATWFMFVAMRRMSQGFATANDTADRIAQGDLTQPIQVTGRDEISHLLGHMQVMQEQLKNLITSIHSSTATIVEVSQQVATGANLLSDRTDQQASSLQETSAATEELTSTVHQNAANAAEAERTADAAADVARQGGQSVNEVVHTMEAINDSSQKISEIVNIIDSIAFQTNILALNAAVEAARAGEQGRGFAVVASEVRALAQRSSTAANEVKVLIEESARVVENGNSQVANAGQRMEEIVKNNEQMNVLIQEIATASQEQSIGLSQINQAITLMDDTTHQNVELVEETASASAVLREQVNELLQHVAAFNIGAATNKIIDINDLRDQSEPYQPDGLGYDQGDDHDDGQGHALVDYRHAS